MADTIYVNVSGAWKTVTNYYVNVGGTWKSGSSLSANISNVWTSTSSGTVSLPTALDQTALDYQEFMCLPQAYVSSKQGIDGTGLDYAEWGVEPIYTRDSTFVWTAPPAAGPSILPSYTDVGSLDYAEWQVQPYVIRSASGLVDMAGLDAAEFMCQPLFGLGPAAPPPPTITLPTATEVTSLDYEEFMCQPTAYVSSKSGIDGKGLDYAEWTVNPYYTVDSSFVYVAPPPAGPSILPTSTDIKSLDYAEWQVYPTIYVSAKATIDGGSLDSAEFMCQPTFTTN